MIRVMGFGGIMCMPSSGGPKISNLGMPKPQAKENILQIEPRSKKNLSCCLRIWLTKIPNQDLSALPNASSGVRLCWRPACPPTCWYLAGCEATHG